MLKNLIVLIINFLIFVVNVSDNRGFSSGLNDIAYFFDSISQNKLDRLHTNLELVSVLANKNLIRDAQDTENIVRTSENRSIYEYDIEKLSTHLELFTVLIDNNIINSICGGSDLDYFFYITAHNDGNIDRLYNLDLSLLAILIDVNVIDDIRDLSIICRLSKTDVENLNSLGSNLLELLINKEIIPIESNDNGWYNYLKDALLNKKNEGLIASMKNNLLLTKTLLNMNDLIEVLGVDAIKELIIHSQYSLTNPDNFKRNCNLVLVLYKKGIIKNIVDDCLFNSQQIKNDVIQYIEKNIEFIDRSDLSRELDIVSGVFYENTLSIHGLKLKELVLVEFIKNSICTNNF